MFKRKIVFVICLCISICFFAKAKITTSVALGENDFLMNKLTDWEIERTEKIVIRGKDLDTQDFATLKNMIINYKLREIDIENTVTRNIRNYAFDGCDKLEKIKLPKYLVYIGHSAFLGCSSLVEIEFPSSLDEIASVAFRECHSLKSVRFNRRLRSIGGQAFLYCENLKEIHCTGEIPPTSVYSAFNGLYETCQLYVPKECKKSYMNSDGWLFFKNIKEEIVEEPCFLNINMNGWYGEVRQVCPNYTGDGGTYLPGQVCFADMDGFYVDKGESVVLFINLHNLSERYIKAIYLDGVDITSQLLYDSMLFINVEKDVRLDIFIEDRVSTTNENLQSTKWKLSTFSGVLFIDNAKLDEIVNVYDINGTLVYSTISKSDRLQINLQDNQVYIVQIGTDVLKIRL